jgi:aerobic carbon-monoxide dehydrogenase medium subunit
MYTSRPAAFTYHRAASVDDAVRLLGELDDPRVLAGGHSLLPAMKLRLSTPAALVDIGRIPGLDSIVEEDGNSVRIGALARHADIASSDLVRHWCPALSDAAGQIGDRQVRNRGTIGGSLAHADPGADYPPVLVALAATITVAGAGGTRDIAAADFFTGLFTTALQPGELITSVRVPAGRTSAYVKHPHPASGYSVVGVAVVIRGADAVQRTVIGGACAVPVDVSDATDVGEALGDGVFSDTYASADYRRHLAGVLLKRAFDPRVEPS